MITMDFQGITWAGNIYQKFETMCLEVEEVMYQDTVKYVENQVQTVGANLKKFYSDVMQDLLPPSSIDPVKVAAADLSLNPYADYGINKKPKASINEDAIKVNKQVTEDSRVISGVNADQTSSLSGLHDVNHIRSPSYGVSVKGACPELYLGQNKDGRMYEHSNVVIRRNSRKNNHPPSELSGSITSVSRDVRRASSCYEISENREAACDQIAMISPPGSIVVRGCDSGEEEKVKFCNNTVGMTASTTDASIDFSVSDMILSVESSGKKGTKLIRTSSSGGSGGLSVESNAADTCTNSGVVSQIGSYISGETHHIEPAGEEVVVSHTGRSGDCDTVVIENNGTIEPGMETIDQSGNSELEETCVLVDGDKLCFVSQGEGKRRSYKKKIREALSSKMRSARKQEYEQLAARYGDTDSESNQESAEGSMPTLSMDANNSPRPDICESEWELL
uniref:Uncharacterized protein n=1 Tax=Davidia involucrata TaxID=16924 RepID=A0A5B7AJE7_DAVIN